jgi:hypothetical protein
MKQGFKNVSSLGSLVLAIVFLATEVKKIRFPQKKVVCKERERESR